MDKFIQTHGKRLFGLCMHLCRNRDEAEELYQETWLKALRNFGQYDPAQDFGPWVSRICVNTYRDMLRKKKRSPFADWFSTFAEKDAAMEKVAAGVRDYSDLAEAVSRLPEPLRVTVILFYYHDLSLQDTAKTLALPEGTVKSRLYTARKRLKEMLCDE